VVVDRVRRTGTVYVRRAKGGREAAQLNQNNNATPPLAFFVYSSLHWLFFAESGRVCSTGCFMTILSHRTTGFW
jgi:hypothetical protein